MRRALIVLAVLLVGSIGWWLLRASPEPPVEVPVVEAPKIDERPVAGAPCRVEIEVRGGELSRARLFSARAQLDVPAEVREGGFSGVLPEQGRVFVAAETVDGRSAGRWLSCSGSGELFAVLEMPPRDPDAATLDGRCTYLDTGAPVAGAVVRGRYDSGVTTNVVSALADDDGAFRVALPAGLYVFRCAKDADEGAPVRLRLEPGAAQSVELFVEARAGVVAQVVDASGEPMADVVVRGRPARATLAGDELFAETTDEDGRALLMGFAPGPVTLTAQASGSFAEGHAVARIELPYAEATLTMMPSPVQLEGTINDKARDPVEGVAVEVTTLDREGALRFAPIARVATTDRGGHFVVGGLVPGRHLVAARAEGYADSRVEVTLPLGTTQVGLTMLPSCTGSLTVEPSSPVLPVRVTLDRDDGAKWDLAGRTGEVLAIPDASGTVRIYARTSGASVRTATATATLCGDPVVVRLSGGEGDGALVVKVLDGGGAPVEGVDVWIDAAAGRARTDADGQVRFDGLAPRTYRVGTPDVMRGATAKVFAGQVETVELVVDRKRGTIRGLVVARGAPTEGARIIAACSDTGRAKRLDEASVVARSGPDGRFSFEPRGGGVCSVRAEHASAGRSRAVTLQAGGDPATIRLEPGASIEGRAVAAETSAPISPYTLVIRTAGSAAEVETRTQYVADPDGAFRVDDVAAGRVALRISGTSGRAYREIDVAPGEAKRGVELRVFTRGSVTGRAVSRDGDPVPGARIEIRSGERSVARTATGPDGRFSVPVRAGEPVSAYATARGFYPKGTPPTAMSADGPTELGTLTLEPRGGDEEKQAGIGIMIANDPRGIRIVNFVDRSPAREAGLRIGDLIVGIDGVPAGQEPLMNWVVSLRGPVGTPVTLEVERGTESAFLVTVIRREVGLRRLPQRIP